MPAAPPLQCFVNPRRGVPGLVTLNAAGFRRARAELAAWPDYAPTPLAALPAAAAQAGVASVHVKDEAHRFGPGCVEALGGAYAVLGVIRTELARSGAAPNATAAALMAGAHRAAAAAVTLCCAAGNHGRSVAWAARRFGAACEVFVGQAGREARADAIAADGARLHHVPGTGEDALCAAVAAAEREGWTVVSDTSWPGYTEIPREAMQAGRIAVDEALDQLPAPPTHILVQGAAGALAAAAAVHARARLDPVPALVVVEPDAAACLLRRAEAGPAAAPPGAPGPAAAGLAPSRPGLLAWGELDRSAAAFLAIPGAALAPAMRHLAQAGIGSSQTGAAGLAGLLAAAADRHARAALGLDAGSRLLLFNTEGAAEPTGAGALGP